MFGCHDFTLFGARNVCINLGCQDGSMTKQLLDISCIHISFHQQCCQRVPIGYNKDKPDKAHKYRVLRVCPYSFSIYLSSKNRHNEGCQKVRCSRKDKSNRNPPNTQLGAHSVPAGCFLPARDKDNGSCLVLWWEVCRQTGVGQSRHLKNPSKMLIPPECQRGHRQDRGFVAPLLHEAIASFSLCWSYEAWSRAERRVRLAALRPVRGLGEPQQAIRNIQKDILNHCLPTL